METVWFSTGVVGGPVGDRQDADLLWRHPGGQRPGVGLDQVGQGPLIAAQAGAVDDIGQLFLTVGVGVVHAELFGQEHVDLNGDDGVLFAEDVLVLDVQLGAVEGGLVDADGVFYLEIVQNFAHDALGLVPLLRRADIFLLVVGVPLGEAEGAVLQHAHGFQAVLGQLQAALEFLLQLLRPQDQVALGDGELADPNEAVHLTGVLVAEQGRGLSQSHGQVPVGAGPVQEHLVLEGAGHGPQGEAILGFPWRPWAAKWAGPGR